MSVLICGAGPAGTACGIALLKQVPNTQVTLVEKYPLPRTKLCAGLLTHKSQDQLLDLLGQSYFDQCLQYCRMSEDASFYLHNGYNLVLQGVAKQPITLISRPKFDYWMARHFLQLGGNLIDGDALTELHQNSAVLSSGRDLEFDQLVAADGANSHIAHLAGIWPSHKNAFCIEVNLPSETLPLQGTHLYFNLIPDSYAWAFAKGSEVCLGMVKLPGKDFDINVSMRDFLKQLGVANADHLQLKGAPLPYCSPISNPIQKGIHFVGDAAGLVEFPTGEGIYYALASGTSCGRSLATNNSKIFTGTHTQLQHYIKKGAFYQRCIERPWLLKLFLKKVEHHPNFLAYFYDTQIDHATDDSLIKILKDYKQSR